MQKIPSDAAELLQKIATEFPVIFGEDLVGIYLYGSLTQNAFEPERSDIDCIVVTEKELSDGHFVAVERWLTGIEGQNSWIEKLQMQFLLRDHILTMDSPACLYQFGKFNRDRSDGNPIIWKNILDTGITLYGRLPEEFVPAITAETLHGALVREAAYIREEIENPASEWRDVPKYRAYAVLTLCRILYSHATREVASKPAAAAFVRETLSEELREIVIHALSPQVENWKNISLESIAQFIELTENRLQNSR